MLASVTHCDPEVPAYLNQGLSLLLHEVRVSTTFLFDYQTIHSLLSLSLKWYLPILLIVFVGGMGQLQLDQVLAH